jgi:hypothetical protein
MTAALACALAAVLLVPAAAAKPGNGNGNGGGGKPAWAGGGGGPNGGGKPEWAGAGKAKKAERQAAREGEAEPGEAAPKHDNPAWICKFEREQMGAEAFAEAYGENESKANVFGKCVSQEAHDRDGVTEEEAPAPEEETDETGDSTGEEPDGTALPASVEAFLHYLWPLLFQL